MHPDLGPSADLSKVLSLDNIRQTLIRQEDTIIFSLIERAQFARNAAVYEPDAIPVPGFNASGQRYSLLEYLLRETEQVHGKIRYAGGCPVELGTCQHRTPVILYARHKATCAGRMSSKLPLCQ